MRRTLLAEKFNRLRNPAPHNDAATEQHGGFLQDTLGFGIDEGHQWHPASRDLGCIRRWCRKKQRSRLTVHVHIDHFSLSGWMVSRARFSSTWPPRRTVIGFSLIAIGFGCAAPYKAGETS